jgi:hypothetical protein
MAAVEGEGSKPGELYALQGRCPISPAQFLPPVPALRTDAIADVVLAYRPKPKSKPGKKRKKMAKKLAKLTSVSTEPRQQK